MAARLTDNEGCHACSLFCFCHLGTVEVKIHAFFLIFSIDTDHTMRYIVVLGKGHA